MTGSRTWRDYDAVEDRLRELPPDSRVIVGDAHGADRMAAFACRRLGIPYTVFKADWNLHGNQAGHVRNHQMIDQQPDMALAFDNGTPGTTACIAECERVGIPVTRTWSWCQG